MSGSGERRCGVRCLRALGGGARWRLCWLSGREWDLPQASEGSGQGECPGPVLGQALEHFALSSGDAGSDMQQPIPERLGLGAVQLGLAGQQHRLGEGEQVRGDQGELDPYLVHVLVPGRYLESLHARP